MKFIIIGLVVLSFNSANAKSIECLPASIKVILSQISTQCGGAKVISAFRPGARIRGTNHASFHAACRAADFSTPNPTCAMLVLANWNGGFLHAYYRMKPNHFHIDNGPRIHTASLFGRSKRTLTSKINSRGVGFIRDKAASNTLEVPATVW